MGGQLKARRRSWASVLWLEGRAKFTGLTSARGESGSRATSRRDPGTGAASRRGKRRQVQPASGPRARAGRSGATASEQRGAEEFGEGNGWGKRKELTAGPGLSARGGARERLSCGAWHWRAGWARGERCTGEAGASGRLGWVPFLLILLFLFLFLVQTKFEFKYKFEFKPHSNKNMHQHECYTNLSLIYKG